MVTEGVDIRSAVALDDDAAQPEQARAVVAAGVHARLERAAHWGSEPGDDHPPGIAREFPAQEAYDHLRHPLGSLEQRVADEAVADHHVGRSLEDVVAFDVAVIVEAARAQQLGGLLDRLVALDVLDADIEQADRRPLLVLDRAYEHRAHDAELHELLRRAVDIGAEVEHVGVAAFHVGQHGGDRRPVDARQGLQHEARDRHQRAGVAGAHARMRLAALYEVDRHAHGGILLVAQRLGRRLVHADDFARVVNAQARAGLRSARGELGLEHLACADEDHVDVRGLRLEFKRGRNRHTGAVIAPHAIDGYGDQRATRPWGSSRLSCRDRSRSG